MKKIILVGLNTGSLIAMLYSNYKGATGGINNKSVGEVSKLYDSLFAPAGYAFAIWSLIFLLAICFVVNHWLVIKNDTKDIIGRTGLWFALSNTANIIWLFLWTNQQIGWSVVVILLLLITMCVLTVKLRMELDDEPVRTIFFVWWPIVIYLGWVMVATIACLAAWLGSIDFSVTFMNEVTWTITMIVIATTLYLYLLKTRNLREAAGVGIWAFVAIAVRQSGVHHEIVVAASVASAVLLIAIGYHGYKNRKYSIGAKLNRGEWNKEA